jgi:NADPH:quinone reductase and related Zn-dependent oxidoreductases
MKAWQYSSTAGGIEKNLVLNQNVPVPSLAPYIGARDSVLLVRVLSASLNPVDYKVPELGIVSRAVTGMQATPGLDFCGRVVQSTPTVDDFAVGDLVFGHLDFQQHGTTGEYIVVPTKHCARVPEGVSIDEAATLGVAAVTAYRTWCPLSSFFTSESSDGGEVHVGANAQA